MKTKVIILGVLLTLIPAVANAKGHHSNPNHGLRHIHLPRHYKGTITIYK
jgi:hypothetical protein